MARKHFIKQSYGPGNENSEMVGSSGTRNIMSSNSVVLAMKIVQLAIVGSSGTRNNFSSNSVALALKIVQFAKVGCSGKGGTV